MRGTSTGKGEVEVVGDRVEVRVARRSFMSVRVKKRCVCVGGYGG